jgi:hypothetical protein
VGMRVGEAMVTDAIVVRAGAERSGNGEQG